MARKTFEHFEGERRRPDVYEESHRLRSVGRNVPREVPETTQ